MAVIKFTATRLTGTGKRGILKPDADGYYTMPVGGLNVVNSVGQYYTADGARQLFEQSGALVRRIKNGCLKGEVGHPKKEPGMSDEQYMNRVLHIEETNVCCFFKEIWLDDSYGKNNPEFKNPDLVAIMAKIKPSGPKGEQLQKAFDDPDQNVCFSIRSLTRDYYEKGKCYRVLQLINTWDLVTEPGLTLATKWNSPALESLTETTVSENTIERIAKTQAGISLESTQLAQECLTLIRSPIREPSKIPLYSSWGG